MSRSTSLLAIATMLALAAATALPRRAAGADAGADLIIHGGPILTMAGDAPSYVEAVVVDDGKIVFAGSDAEAMRQKVGSTIVKDLGARSCCPALSTRTAISSMRRRCRRQVNVSPSPVGSGDSAPEIIAALKAYQAKAKVSAGGWILAYGYDDSMVKGGTLTRADLDAAFPRHLVMVTHVSLHGAVLNSKALAWAGITRDTPTPEGGIIARGPDGKEPSGLVMETAFVPIFAKLPQPAEAERMALLKPGQMMYAANGSRLPTRAIPMLPICVSWPRRRRRNVCSSTLLRCPAFRRSTNGSASPSSPSASEQPAEAARHQDHSGRLGAG